MATKYKVVLRTDKARHVAADAYQYVEVPKSATRREGGFTETMLRFVRDGEMEFEVPVQNIEYFTRLDENDNE